MQKGGIHLTAPENVPPNAQLLNLDELREQIGAKFH